MSEKLCTLRTKGGGGGRYTETSLWTNPSPSSDFAAQTVTLSDNINNYKYLKVSYRNHPTIDGVNDPYSVLISVSDFKTSLPNNSTRHNAFTYGGIYAPTGSAWTRFLFYDTDTTARFGGCTQIGGTGSTNNNAIPLEILGLNELDHGTMYTSNADVQQFKSVSASAIPTFTTKGKAVAIYITRYVNSNTKAVVYTNVNPTTGAINNSEIYVSDTDSMPWAIWSQGTFIVTDNQITTNKAFSTTAHKLAIMYTY